MTKYKLLTATLTALALAACTNEVQDTLPTMPAANLAQDNAPVAFAASAQGSTSRPTRAGQTGIISNLADLRDNYKYFGVFGYYTNAGKFTTEGENISTPNFMYNQCVEWDGEQWGYSPVKYWPNEWNGNIENSATAGTPTDRLSFFAYAPYVTGGELPADVSAKAVATGIIGMSGNEQGGAPTLEYRCPPTGTGVDLLWGVSKDDYSSRTGVTVEAGMPFIDLVKPNDQSRHIPFHFRHALGQFGVTVVLSVDNATYDAANTKVMIEEVEILSADGSSALFATHGTLSLNNTVPGTPAWTVDGGETLTRYNFSTADMLPALAYTTPKGTLNAWQAQGSHTGVTTTRQALTADGRGALFIPSAGADFKVRVRYHVITRDSQLGNECTDNVNDITSDALTGMTLEAGKTTRLNITLTLRQLLLQVETMEMWNNQEP